MQAIDRRREGADKLVEVVGDLRPGSREVIGKKNGAESVHIDVEESAVERAPAQECTNEVSRAEGDGAHVAGEQNVPVKINLGQVRSGADSAVAAASRNQAIVQEVQRVGEGRRHTKR